MNSLNVCQLCRFCMKGSHLFQIKLSYYDDVTRKIKNVNSMERISKFSFQCQFCCMVSTVDFENICTPHCVLELKEQAKQKEKKIRQIIQQLMSLLVE